MAQAALAASPASPGDGEEKIKLMIQVSPAAKDRLFEMKDQIKAKSVPAVARQALHVYDELLQEIKKGNEVCICAQGGRKVSVRCAPPNGADFDGLVSTIDSGHLGALYGCEAEEAALAG